MRGLSQVEIDRIAESGRKSLEKERGVIDQPPTLRNTALAINLDGDDTLTWRGRVYTVPPVAWDDGARLLEIQTRLQDVANRKDSSVAEYRALMADAVELFPYLIRRHWLVRLLTWLFPGLLPNPFRRATGQEVGQLLGFFFACQTKRQPVAISAFGSTARPQRSTSRSG